LYIAIPFDRKILDNFHIDILWREQIVYLNMLFARTQKLIFIHYFRYPRNQLIYTQQQYTRANRKNKTNVSFFLGILSWIEENIKSKGKIPYTKCEATSIGIKSFNFWNRTTYRIHNPVSI